MEKKRLISGDRPTGKLHLGHYVGSIQNRLELQKKYTTYLFIADLHMLTTKKEKEAILKAREHIHDMMLDYLSIGLDPSEAVFYLQSAVPEVAMLSLIFGMMTPINHLQGLPSIKEMAKNAHIAQESVPLGLIGYPVLQAADILLSKAHIVPVGKDNEAHIELTRDIAKRFNALYGEVFPIPEIILSDTPSLIGTDGKGKMSKSANNAILLSDPSDIVHKKVKSMFTDAKRIHMDIPGDTENNPVFIYHRTFNMDKDEVASLTKQYQQGTIGDVAVKESLYIALEKFLNPIREKRKLLEADKGYIERVLYEGTLKMQDIAHATMKEVLSAMGISGTWNKISRIARDKKV